MCCDQNDCAAACVPSCCHRLLPSIEEVIEGRGCCQQSSSVSTVLEKSAGRRISCCFRKRALLLLLLSIFAHIGSSLEASDSNGGVSSISDDSVDFMEVFSNTRASRKLRDSKLFIREICGRQFFPTGRIVGGERASFGQWPWLISLRQWRAATFQHKCGAALVNQNWAITAAHCVEDTSPQELLLRLGEYDVSTDKEPYGYVERRVQLVATHPKFDPKTFEYDLALVRLDIPVALQPHIIPICLPEDDADFLGHMGHIAGWGRLSANGPLPSVLQQVAVPVLDNPQCENMYRRAGFNEYIPKMFICAGYRRLRKDSCTGDSGGPFVIQRPDARWLLAGISSWGIGCGEPNRPGVYTRISEFREWIENIMAF